jgi:hypothetical protein
MSAEVAVPDEVLDAEIVGIEEEPVVCWGAVIIEWPAPDPENPLRPVAGWKCALYDAATGGQIYTVTAIEVRAPVDGAITADLTMHANEHGQPVLALAPGDRKGTVKMPATEDGKPFMGTFRFDVAEMRIRS